MLRTLSSLALGYLFLSKAVIISSAAVVEDTDHNGHRTSFPNVEHFERRLRINKRQRKKEEAAPAKSHDKHHLHVQEFLSEHPIKEEVHHSKLVVDTTSYKDSNVDAVSKKKHTIEHHDKKKKKRDSDNVRGKIGKTSKGDESTIPANAPTTYFPTVAPGPTPVPSGNVRGKTGKTHKSSKSKGGKSAIVPTNVPTAYFPTYAPTFDWCPEVSVRPSGELRSNEWTPWGDRKPSKKDKVKKTFNVHKKTVKIPEAGDDGGKPLIDEIVGGTDVEPARKYKFFASLGGCGGSLVAPNVVLSAAHCQGVSDSVTLGMQQWVIDTDEVEEFNNLEHIPIKQSVRHPCYNYETSDYDFWVIELEWSTQKYKDYVVKLDAPTDGLDLDDGGQYQLTVMGFGRLFGGGPILPNLMQEVTLDYIPNDSCGNYPPGEITDAMLCAGSLGQDSCQGDSGGPIIDSATQKQVGVVSWGDGCANTAYPGVYARVSVGYDWIATYITQWEANVPAPAPGVCVDDPEGWFDSGGPNYNCLWYASDSTRCSKEGERFANGGVTANMACCACAPLDYPNEIHGNGKDGAESFNVTFRYNGTYVAAAHGLEPATVTSDTIIEGEYQLHEYELSGAVFFRIVIPPEAVANSDIDLDIYLIDPLGEVVDSSENWGTDELVEIVSPMDGNWSVYVYGFNTVGLSADYDMYSWIISATPGGNMNIDSAPVSAQFNETETISLSWTGATEEEWHLGAVSHTGKGSLTGLTLVNVDNRNRVPGYPNEIYRTGEEVTTSFYVTFGYNGTYVAAAHGLEPATITSGTVIQRRDGYELHELELSGAAFLRIAIPPEAVTNPDDDIDIYLVNPLNQLVAQSIEEGTDELVEIFSPMDGLWSVYIKLFAGGNTGEPSTADYDMYSWVVSASPGGNMNIDSAPDSAVLGAMGAINISWTDAAEGEWHLGAVSHSNGTSLFALTFVDVDNRIPV